MSVELGILGAGNMAEAIARGVVRAGLWRAEQILAADVSAQRREVFTQDLGIRAVEDSREAARQARTLLLSVKPQHMGELLAHVRGAVGADTLIISIAAGISTRFIEQSLGNAAKWRVVRTMPNTPMLVGEGMVALARGQFASEQDAGRVWRLFECAADVIEVREEQLDAVTALSGSGPAYVFYLVEQMIRAGQELGLSPAQARQLAIKTTVGASRMLATSGETPEQLRGKVTSPGGTTQAAISHLEQDGVGINIVEAIKAAAQRSKELGS